MNAKQIELVKTSWLKVLPIADVAAELFYSRLFEIAPEVKPLFKGNMKEQGAKLMKMIGTAVNHLENLSEVLLEVENMAVRHVAYGVKEKHYDVVGEALLWTLGQGLGNAFTKEVEEAWALTYLTIAGVMKGAVATKIVA